MNATLRHHLGSILLSPVSERLEWFHAEGPGANDYSPSRVELLTVGSDPDATALVIMHKRLAVLFDPPAFYYDTRDPGVGG